MKKCWSVTNIFAADSNDIYNWAVSLAQIWNIQKKLEFLNALKEGLFLLLPGVPITFMSLGLKKGFLSLVLDPDPRAVIVPLMFLLPASPLQPAQTLLQSLRYRGGRPLRRRRSGRLSCLWMPLASLLPSSSPVGQFVTILVIKVREKCFKNYVSFSKTNCCLAYSYLFASRNIESWPVEYLKFKIDCL